MSVCRGGIDQTDRVVEPARDIDTVDGHAGRHGWARRHYRRYAESMAEIDVRPAPFPF